MLPISRGTRQRGVTSFVSRRGATLPCLSHAERGVTLIELMIAVSLVAVMSVGMLFALRTSVLAYEKTGARLRANREQVSRTQILARELAGAMPVLSLCGVNMTPYFMGASDSLHMISSYSVAEGSRGYPQIIEFQVMRSPVAGVQLVVTEQPYTGPFSTTPFCDPTGGAVSGFSTGAPPFVLADRLASCEFSYHQPVDMLAYQDTGWVPVWKRNVLPAGIRVELTPLATAGGGLPSVAVTVPLRVDRDIFMAYDDF
ncbi:MAG TPA: prepilin-type N-terminal cleavage/methylation domain-containing protein [Bryobacteraceae bacterium]|nr:prepilin-type N-terminal cleavage/methylation domain-containing protein [Bryobacteraceae bacterium]